MTGITVLHGITEYRVTWAHEEAATLVWANISVNRDQIEIHFVRQLLGKLRTGSVVP
jgi:hypothetical protein